MDGAVWIEIIGEKKLEEIAEKYHLTEAQIKQIGTAAINRSLTTVQSRVVKRLADDINMRQKDIRSLTSISRATYSKDYGSVDIKRRLIPLFDFIGARQTEKGVTVQVRKDKPRELLRSTFIATMKSGHEGIFEREEASRVSGDIRQPSSTDTIRVRVGRLPIFERFGPTLTAYFANAPGVLQEEKRNAMDVFAKNIDSQLQRRLAEAASRK